ncbi:MAG: hypothetical protein NVS3B17_15920 [Vulcanimicrobiaceae bacterium]
MSQPFAAAFDSTESLAQAVTEIARLGRTRDSIAVATRSSKTLDDVVRDLGVARIDAGVHHDGVFADLARATGQREATAPDALAHELVARGVDPGRAGYFDRSVRDGALLLVVASNPNDEAAVYAALVRFGADLGLANGAGLRRTIPLRREVIDVRKVAVVTGEVVVRTEILSERKVIELVLEREVLVIERRDPRAPNAAPEITHIPIRHEEAIVSKETIVTGEAHVRTEQFVDTSTIEETVRYEVLRVEGDENLTS